ncbi:MAG: hydrogenase nickel incorporation protein HypB [Planctomycetaceae bacterium]|nr:hydrogenase nickel incorporation protein HypB [Planctomycetaceae bacterium]
MSFKRVVVRRDVLADAKADAAVQRSLFSERGVFVINLVSSPGAGKTALLEATAKFWDNKFRIAVLVGDLETERDAERLAPYTSVAQLTTGGACHLQLPLVQRGLAALGDPELDFLFIENVGNLVCPAAHDLAEHLRVVLLSVTDGDDKPGKYPKIFRSCQTLVISKIDLLPYVPFRVELARQDALEVQPTLQCLTVSSLLGTGVAEWCNYLESQRAAMLAQRSLQTQPNHVA